MFITLVDITVYGHVLFSDIMAVKGEHLVHNIWSCLLRDYKKIVNLFSNWISAYSRHELVLIDPQVTVSLSDISIKAFLIEKCCFSKWLLKYQRPLSVKMF